MFAAYRLGATLYMPVIHPKVPDIVSGLAPAPASSIVLCLEDALHESDVEEGIRTLTELLKSRPGKVGSRPQVFIRPRSYDMACRLRAIEGITQIDGFVFPKARTETAPDWISLLSGTTLKLMPTLETPEFFDPARLIQFRDLLLSAGPDRIAAVRIGGNDLLGAMALRRVRGMTAYEGPLGWFLSMAASILIPAGIPVSAPVFDIIEDTETLRREVERDVEMGFVSKTAIHPAQVSIIEGAFSVSEQDRRAARAILDRDAGAVFQIGGVMCEPATHAAWARRIMARADRFGCQSFKRTDYDRETGTG
jgi:citrate lyase beta subunit